MGEVDVGGERWVVVPPLLPRVAKCGCSPNVADGIDGTLVLLVGVERRKPLDAQPRKVVPLRGRGTINEAQTLE